MKKYLSLLLILMLGFGFYVKADAGPPRLGNFKMIVTNKNGAACYEDTDGKTKTGKSIPYNKEVRTFSDYGEDYITVEYELSDGTSENCTVSVKDITPKDSRFDVNNEDVKKITPVKAVILAKGGLNLRKGPSTLFERITTIKQGEVVTLTHNAGTYWYYTNYNGNNGWISGENGYFGYDNNRIIYSYSDISIYDFNNREKKIGTIPKFTEVTDYLSFAGDGYSPDVIDGWNYVNYKGIKGLIFSGQPIKVEGKIKLDKDVKINNGKTLTKGTYDYSIRFCYDEDRIIPESDSLIASIGSCKFYIPSVNGTILLEENSGYIIINEKEIKKTSGYIGEGLYGEAKTKKEDTPVVDEPIVDEPTEEPIIDEPIIDVPTKAEKEFKFDTEMIIICVMGAIILGLTAFIIIKFANVNKKEKNKKVEVKKEEKKEIEPEKKEE